jgi:quercetin dioxygenase-like cupin family protein
MTPPSTTDSFTGRPDVVVSTTASAGAATWAMGSLFERLVSASDTGGQLGVSVVTQPSGAASPLHVHTREAEAWYVLDGEMTYVAGARTVRMVSGDFIYLPPNVPHAFRVTGPRSARFLALSLPGQLLDLYDEVGTPALERRLPDGGVLAGEVVRWNEIGARYGIRVVGPPIPEAHPMAPSHSSVQHHRVAE